MFQWDDKMSCLFIEKTRASNDGEQNRKERKVEKLGMLNGITILLCEFWAF